MFNNNIIYFKSYLARAIFEEGLKDIFLLLFGLVCISNRLPEYLPTYLYKWFVQYGTVSFDRDVQDWYVPTSLQQTLLKIPYVDNKGNNKFKSMNELTKILLQEYIMVMHVGSKKLDQYSICTKIYMIYCYCTFLVPTKYHDVTKTPT